MEHPAHASRRQGKKHRTQQSASGKKPARHRPHGEEEDSRSGKQEDEKISEGLESKETIADNAQKHPNSHRQQRRRSFDDPWLWVRVHHGHPSDRAACTIVERTDRLFAVGTGI
jgi:hypothetical protein